MAINSTSALAKLKWPTGATAQYFSGYTTASQYTYTGTVDPGYYVFIPTSLDNTALGYIFSSSTNNLSTSTSSLSPSYFQITTSATDFTVSALGIAPTTAKSNFRSGFDIIEMAWDTTNLKAVGISKISTGGSYGAYTVPTSSAVSGLPTTSSWSGPYTIDSSLGATAQPTGYLAGSPGKFVLASANGLYYSTDGVTWVKVTTPVTDTTPTSGNYFSGNWTLATYLNGNFIVGADTGTLITSTDGITWTNRLGANQYLTSFSRNGIYQNGKFITPSQINSGALGTSTDGIYWSGIKTGTGTTTYSVAYLNTNYVAVGTSGKTSISTDSVTWSRNSTTTTGSVYSVSYSTSGYVVVGASGYIATSTDTVTWTVRTSGTTGSIYGVTSGPAALVAAGASGYLSSSTDGATWTARTSQFGTSTINNVKYLNTRFLAVGAGGRISSSTDGTTWSGVSVGTNTWNDATYYNGNYIIVGDLGYYAYSTDTVTWSTPAQTNANAPMYLVVSSGTYLLGLGITTLSYSTNGTTWSSTYGNPNNTTAFTVQYSASRYSAAYTNGRWAIGSSTAVTGGFVSSTDLVTWSANTSIAYQTTNSPIGLTGFFNTFYTGSQGDRYASSTDAITWTVSTNTNVPATVTAPSYNSMSNDGYGSYIIHLGDETSSYGNYYYVNTALTFSTAKSAPSGTQLYSGTPQYYSLRRATPSTTGNSYVWFMNTSPTGGPLYITGGGALPTATSTIGTSGLLTGLSVAAKDANNMVAINSSAAGAGSPYVFVTTNAGSTWSTTAFPGNPSQYVSNIVYGNGYYVVVAYFAGTAYFYYSTDGVTWGNFATSLSAVSVNYQGTKLVYDSVNSVFLYNPGSGVRTYYYSTNGTNWTTNLMGGTTTTGTVTALAAGSGYQAYADSAGELLVYKGPYSPRNTYSQSLYTGIGAVSDMVIGNNTLVAMTTTNTVYVLPLNIALTSGFTGSGSGLVSSGTTSLTSITFPTTIFSGTISNPNNYVTYGTRLTYNGGVFAAVSASATGFATSTNGITWTLSSIYSQNPTSGFGNYTSTGYYAVQPYLNNQFIVSGFGTIALTSGGTSSANLYSLYKIVQPTLP